MGQSYQAGWVSLVSWMVGLIVRQSYQAGYQFGWLDLLA